MSKGKRNREKRKKAPRRNAGLADHQRHKKVLTPPLMTLPKMTPTSWVLDSLPDFLWLQTIVEERSDLALANNVVDLLDGFVDDVDPSKEATETLGPPVRALDYLDGRLSTMPLIVPERRSEARAALREAFPWAMPDDLLHGLALYPECPAAWLYEDWLDQNEVDSARGIAYLQRLVAPLLDPRGRPASRLRQIPLARMIKHGKMLFNEGMGIVELLPRYPGGLTLDEQLRVEQWGRATWNVMAMTADRTVADAWVRHFWRRSGEVSACEAEPVSVPYMDETESDEDLPEVEGRGSPAPRIGELRNRFLTAVDALGDELRKMQLDLPLDMYEPTPDEVKLGLASRCFRLLRRVIADPELWTNEMAPHVVRSMVDLRIVVAWLIKQDDPSLFEKFKDYGVGKRKLFKLQLEELMDREDVVVDEDDEALHQRLEAEVNQDVLEEFVKIDVGGSFSGKNIREMAQETELAELYSLTYQPLSTEAHGEWGSLVAFDLRHCGNPLHRYHRLGTFDTPMESIVHLGWIGNALSLARDTIEEIFGSYGADTSAVFDRCLEAMTRAQEPEDAA